MRLLKISMVIFVLSALGVPASVWAQSVKAYVDRNPVMADETLRLVIEAEGVSASDEPDFHELEANFDLLGTSHSQQMSIINGRTSSVTRWVTTLAPKRTGMLSIPTLQVGSATTLPLTVRVKEPGRISGPDSQRDIFLEAEVDTHFPYVQGQVLLTLRLVSAISLQEGKLDDPEIEWGMVERVGKDTSFETMREGRRYQVTERRFVITPQKAGAQTIPPVLLSGSIPDERSSGSTLDQFFNNRRRNQGGGPLTSFFQTLRPVHIRSPKISLTVKEIPMDTKGKIWLPAKAFTIKEMWSEDTENINMGEPLTRTVVMVAKGLRGEQLPELPVRDYEMVKTYPDKAKTTTGFDGHWVTGTREEKYALVPTKPGSVKVPAIRIPWWNIERAQWETAELPSRTLTVHGEAQAPSGRNSHPNLMEAPTQTVHRSPNEIAMEAPEPASPSLGTNLWKWLAAGLLGLWALTLVAWWRDRRKRSDSTVPHKNGKNEKAEASERKVIAAVKAACQEQSPLKAREALLKWTSMKQHGKPCVSLGTAARMLAESVPQNPQVGEAIWNLDRTLYTTTEPQSWDGQRFWEVIQPAMTTKHQSIKKRRTESLPDLYLH